MNVEMPPLCNECLGRIALTVALHGDIRNAPNFEGLCDECGKATLAAVVEAKLGAA